jgi:hypothetical protein
MGERTTSGGVFSRYRGPLAAACIVAAFAALLQMGYGSITGAFAYTYGYDYGYQYEYQQPDLPIAASGKTFNATEGASFSGVVASFTDPDPSATASEYSATIDWGDSSSTSGTISGPTGGPFNVSGTHTYAEEGSYPVTVRITDIDTPTNAATAHSTANVADAALTAGTLTISGGTEGVSPTALSFKFTDANAGATTADFTASIHWGDGSTTSGAVTGGGGAFTVTGSHTYAEEGSYSVHVTVADDGGSTTSANGTAQVADAALAATCGAKPVSAKSFSGTVATFTDANPNGTAADFTATINWGDASSSSGTVTGPTGGPFTVSGTHTYSSTGPFTITVTIVDDGGSRATTSCQVLIFGTASGGNFVIGDKNAVLGKQVTFWGAEWWKKNTLSVGTAPASFKGFENKPATATCGTNWSTAPGNSPPPPPGPLPLYMAVLASSSIKQTGSTISGNTVHMVVVKVDPGYQPNPGHAGTGKVVAVIC